MDAAGALSGFQKMGSLLMPGQTTVEVQRNCSLRVDTQ